MTRWKPNTTVAAIIEQHGRFLIVEETTETGLGLNQPAGHLEQGETLLDAVIREVREETGWDFTPTALVGIYMADKADSDITYLRFAFTGNATPPSATPTLDAGIVATHWMSREELASQLPLHRSPVVMQCLDDYLAGQQYPLAILRQAKGDFIHPLSSES